MIKVQHGKSWGRGHHEVERAIVAGIRRFQPGIVRGAGALERNEYARVEGPAAFAREQPHAAAAYGGNVENAIAVEVANGDVVRIGVGAGLVEDSGLKSAISVAQGDTNTPGNTPGPSLRCILSPGQHQICLMVKVLVGYGEGDRPHARLRNGARAERAVSIAEQHRHVAEAAPLNYVRYAIAIGISHR